MELKRVYVSDLLMDWKKFQQTQLLFPFYSSHGQARTAFFSAVKHGGGYRIQYRSYWLLVDKIDQEDCWEINNLLISTNLGWQTAFLLLENAARQKFKQALHLKFKANIVVHQWLVSQGYQLKAGIWQKELVYHTGLVLGGGGARGAYQIGVWKALLEKNITIEIIAGTSVGSLNGALIVQGDYDQALTLWEKIETNKVLDITFKEVEAVDFSAQVDQLRTFIRTSLQQRGISTEPLRQLLAAHLELSKIQTGCPLYVVTTKVPAFQEIVIAINDCSKEEIIDWLLASSAFFPMMAMSKIKDVFYVDGGYRNNLPVDVALQNPVTELIIVDVHGPGLDKNYRLPAGVAELVLSTPWSLGDLFLFQSDRSAENIELGYLEAKRALGDLQGYRYFFYPHADFEMLTKDFLRYLQPKLTLDWKELYPELQKFFKQAVPVELLSLAFLEFFAYWVKVPPARIFTPSEFIRTILAHVELPNQLNTNLSVQEQIEEFIESRNVFSDYYRVLQIQQQKGSLKPFYRRWPIQTLLAFFFRYIRETNFSSD